MSKHLKLVFSATHSCAIISGNGPRERLGSRMITVHATRLQRRPFSSSWRHLLHISPPFLPTHFQFASQLSPCPMKGKMPPKSLIKKKYWTVGVSWQPNCYCSYNMTATVFVFVEMTFKGDLICSFHSVCSK